MVIKKSAFSKVIEFIYKNRLIVLLVVINFSLRLPSLYEPNHFDDENIYLAVGMAMKKGLVLYKDITDHAIRPPMIFVLSKILKSQLNLRLLLLAWNTLNVVLFYFLINKFAKSKFLSFLFCILFIFFTSTPIIEGNIANTEIFFIMPVTAALILLTSQPVYQDKLKTKLKKNHFYAGLLLGFALLIKTHVIFDVFSFFLFFYIFDKRFDKNLLKIFFKDKSFWLWLTGITIPLLITLIGFSDFQGEAWKMLIPQISLAFSYTNSPQEKLILFNFLRVGSLGLRFVLLILTTLVIALFKNKIPRKLQLVALWILFNLFAVLMLNRFGNHYLIQLVPPIVLGIALLFTTKRWLSRLLLTILFVVIGLIHIFFEYEYIPIRNYYVNFLDYATGGIGKSRYFNNVSNRALRNYKTADYLKENSKENNKVFIWGCEPEIYVLSERLPVGRYTHADIIYSANAYEETLFEIMNSKPLFIVLIEDFELPLTDDLQLILKENYTLTKIIGNPLLGALENTNKNALVYKLN